MGDEINFVIYSLRDKIKECAESIEYIENNYQDFFDKLIDLYDSELLEKEDFIDIIISDPSYKDSFISVLFLDKNKDYIIDEIIKNYFKSHGDEAFSVSSLVLVNHLLEENSYLNKYDFVEFFNIFLKEHKANIGEKYITNQKEQIEKVFEENKQYILNTIVSTFITNPELSGVDVKKMLGLDIFVDKLVEERLALFKKENDHAMKKEYKKQKSSNQHEESALTPRRRKEKYKELLLPPPTQEEIDAANKAMEELLLEEEKEKGSSSKLDAGKSKKSRRKKSCSKKEFESKQPEELKQEQSKELKQEQSEELKQEQSEELKQEQSEEKLPEELTTPKVKTYNEYQQKKKQVNRDRRYAGHELKKKLLEISISHIEGRISRIQKEIYKYDNSIDEYVEKLKKYEIEITEKKEGEMDTIGEVFRSLMSLISEVLNILNKDSQHMESLIELCEEEIRITNNDHIKTLNDLVSDSYRNLKMQETIELEEYDKHSNPSYNASYYNYNIYKLIKDCIKYYNFENIIGKMRENAIKDLTELEKELKEKSAELEVVNVQLQKFDMPYAGIKILPISDDDLLIEKLLKFLN